MDRVKMKSSIREWLCRETRTRKGLRQNESDNPKPAKEVPQ
jgi:hypothetical protein